MSQTTLSLYRTKRHCPERRDSNRRYYDRKHGLEQPLKLYTVNGALGVAKL